MTSLPPHCTVCSVHAPWATFGLFSDDQLISVWYDTTPDTICARCFAWLGTVLHTVKLQRMYT